ncbi:unnamed protein product [Vitrella brassicaformis CCMP3155]|uniref:Uncharacterized protein n=1 Tax=Vitrella brassicaformis (strain CCMP3155) TaxID=1169540 RepID=A0A0G4EAA7_VITBC|nr:unnamed protein product [Vitrella brassicaformis CCMP3155]|eukprot:CEL92410.1 unnamed protein product [Vitrella brassicaformis CCMP3155]
MLTLVKQRIEQAIGRLGLEEVLVFDDGGLEDGLKAVYVLEQGSGEEWRAMGRFIRLAAIYQLTPNATLPLRLSADALPTATAFHQLPLILALYKIIGHLFTYKRTSLQLQQASNDAYRIGNVSFRVLQEGDMLAGHPYRRGYQTSAPAIRRDVWLSPFFSSFLVRTMLVSWWPEEGVDNRRVLTANIGRDANRRGRLMREVISERQGGITVDDRWDEGNMNHANPVDFRRVIVSGFRPGERVAAYLYVGVGFINLRMTEARVGHRSQRLANRFPQSMPS